MSVVNMDNELILDFNIIVPAHNEEKYIGGLLQSLQDLNIPMNQVVVVSGGSTDRTDDIVVSYGARLESRPEKLIPSTSRNIGASLADRKFLVFLDSDVIVTSIWAQALLKIVSEKGNCRSLLGDTYQLSTSPSYIERVWFSELRAKTYLNGGNLVVNQEFFRKIGGFDESLETGEDVDFSHRVEELGGKLVFNSELYVHHEGNPKTIFQFIRRERWHGKGDLNSWSLFKKSKVAVLSLVFLIFLILSFFTTFHEPLSGAIWFLLAWVLCFLLVIKKFKPSPNRMLPLTTIMFLYMFGRSMSLCDRMYRVIKN